MEPLGIDKKDGEASVAPNPCGENTHGLLRIAIWHIIPEAATANLFHQFVVPDPEHATVATSLSYGFATPSWFRRVTVD
jgi:hypothetical protein